LTIRPDLPVRRAFKVLWAIDQQVHTVLSSMGVPSFTARPKVTQADGIDRWWVRSSNGDWIALSHQRVVENEDGTITLLYLQ
jgi:hypothetical protein